MYEEESNLKVAGLMVRLGYAAISCVPMGVGDNCPSTCRKIKNALFRPFILRFNAIR